MATTKEEEERNYGDGPPIVLRSHPDRSLRPGVSVVGNAEAHPPLAWPNGLEPFSNEPSHQTIRTTGPF